MAWPSRIHCTLVVGLPDHVPWLAVRKLPTVADPEMVGRVRLLTESPDVTVSDELRRAGLLDAIGGPGVLAQIMASTPATTNAGRYARIVEEYALLRRLIGVAGEIAELGYSVPEDVSKALDRAESMVYDINERRVTDSTQRISDLLSANLDRLEERGYVERIRVPNDRRVVLVRITAAGRGVLNEVESGREGIFDRILDELDPGQLSRLAAALADLRSALTTTFASHARAHHSHEPQGRN
jgi:DNA-binding PadR family transcriptional regulator